MRASIRPVLIVLGVALALPLAAGSAPLLRNDAAHEERQAPRPIAERGDDPDVAPLVYRVTAERPRLNRKLLGPVLRRVQGVPAEPVDSFVWDGVGSTPIDGRMLIEVQPMTNTGSIEAEWTDENGRWTFKQTQFIHPGHHTSGVRIGSSVYFVDAVLNEGIANNVYLHGDTAAGPPVLPTVFAYLAAWGYAHVTLDGRPFDNPFEIPAPRWLAHVMVTEGVRRGDGSVRTLSGAVYDPSQADRGEVETGDLEAHLTFHDDLLPLTTNVPRELSFFYHLVFEEVRIEITQGDGAQKPAPQPPPVE